MANEVSIFSSKIPAHIQRGKPSALLAAISGSVGGKRLSIKGGVFRLNVSGKEVASMQERQLNVVMIGALSSHLDIDESVWRQAITELVKPQYLDFNLKAFEAGTAH